jgi:hypothetical protein
MGFSSSNNKAISPIRLLRIPADSIKWKKAGGTGKTYRRCCLRPCLNTCGTGCGVLWGIHVVEVPTALAFGLTSLRIAGPPGVESMVNEIVEGTK